ncbi:protein RKD2-like [Pyrus communis]|uniref:protein RKD2-like n=1 Tax=Pyrus communis TaxID=23211 RepID=UPI0035C1B1DC
MAIAHGVRFKSIMRTIRGYIAFDKGHCLWGSAYVPLDWEYKFSPEYNFSDPFYSSSSSLDIQETKTNDLREDTTCKLEEKRSHRSVDLSDTTCKLEEKRSHRSIDLSDTTCKVEEKRSHHSIDLSKETISHHFYMPVSEAAQEMNEVGDGQLNGEVELLERERQLMEEFPDLQLEENTKRLRRAFFKAKYKKKRSMSSYN